MSVTIRVTVEDIETRVLTYNKLAIERSSDVETGYATIDEQLLDADEVYYSHLDVTGTHDHWYRYRFLDTVLLVASEYSNPFQPYGNTRKRIREKAMEEYKAGLLLHAVNGGTTTVAKFSDYRIDTALYQTNRGKGSWLHPVGLSSQSGDSRRVISSSPTTGEFTVDPGWTIALAPGDEVEWHWLASVDDWNLAINRGLQRYAVLERVPIEGNDTQNINLNFLPWLRARAVMGLWYQPSTDMLVDVAWGTRGNWWNVKQDAHDLTLQTRPAISSSQTIYLEAIRYLDPIFTDESLTPLSCNLDLICALAYDELLADLYLPQFGGASSDRTVFLQRRGAHQKKLRELTIRHAPHVRTQRRQLNEPAMAPYIFSAR